MTLKEAKFQFKFGSILLKLSIFFDIFLYLLKWGGAIEPNDTYSTLTTITAVGIIVGIITYLMPILKALKGFTLIYIENKHKLN